MLQNIAHHTSNEAHELRGLFEKQLKELYWTEDAMAAMLCDIAAKSASKDLIIILEKHRSGTLNHLLRLDKIFEAIGITKESLSYEAIDCLIGEAKDITEDMKFGIVRDVAIIAILQKIKHYEIACYGTMRAYAIALREEDVVTLLEQTLEEEKQADLALSYIAESHINIEAADKEI